MPALSRGRGTDDGILDHEYMTALIPIQAVALMFNVTLHILQTLVPLYMYHIGLPPAVLGA